MSLAPHVRRRSWSAAMWNLSTAVALVSVGLVLLAVVMTATAGHFRLLDRFASFVPAPVREWFEQQTELAIPAIPDEVSSSIGRSAPPPAEKRRPARYTVGASQAEVLTIQGRPNRVFGSTWYYGESEVQFVAGRVVAWKNSSKNPLRVR